MSSVADMHRTSSCMRSISHCRHNSATRYSISEFDLIIVVIVDPSHHSGPWTDRTNLSTVSSSSSSSYYALCWRILWNSISRIFQFLCLHNPVSTQKEAFCAVWQFLHPHLCVTTKAPLLLKRSNREWKRMQCKLSWSCELKKCFSPALQY